METTPSLGLMPNFSAPKSFAKTWHISKLATFEKLTPGVYFKKLIGGFICLIALCLFFLQCHVCQMQCDYSWGLDQGLGWGWENIGRKNSSFAQQCWNQPDGTWIYFLIFQWIWFAVQPEKSLHNYQSYVELLAVA